MQFLDKKEIVNYLFNELMHQTTYAQQGYSESADRKGSSVLYGPVEGQGIPSIF